MVPRDMEFRPIKHLQFLHFYYYFNPADTILLKLVWVVHFRGKRWTRTNKSLMNYSPHHHHLLHNLLTRVSILWGMEIPASLCLLRVKRGRSTPSQVLHLIPRAYLQDTASLKLEARSDMDHENPHCKSDTSMKRNSTSVSWRFNEMWFLL